MKKIILLLTALMAITVNAMADSNKLRVVFLGEQTIGKWEWGTYLSINGSNLAQMASGDELHIVLQSDDAAASAAKEIYYQYNVTIDDGDSRPKIYDNGSIESGTSEVIVTPTDEEITQLKANKLMIQGHFVKVKKIAFGKPNTKNPVTGILPLDLKDNEGWGSSCSLDADILHTVNVGDRLMLTFEEGSTSPGEGKGVQVVIQGNNASGIWSDATSYYDVTQGQTTLEIPVTDANVSNFQTFQSFDIKGKNFKLTNVALYTYSPLYCLNATNSNVSLSELPTTTIDVELTRTFDWNSTICLPFEVPSVSSAFDATLGTTKVFEFSEYNNGLVFTEREHIKAGVPYYMERAYNESINDKNATITFEGVTINTEPSNSSESGGLTFKGNYTPGMDMKNKYGVAYVDSWGFYKGASGSKLNAFSAYFEGSIKAARLSIIIDEEVNGINEVQQSISSNHYYTINGMRIDKPIKKGLYILNEKKVIIK